MGIKLMLDVWAIDGKETEVIRLENPILLFQIFGENITSESSEAGTWSQSL